MKRKNVIEELMRPFYIRIPAQRHFDFNKQFPLA